jgi:hypothetical protein
LSLILEKRRDERDERAIRRADQAGIQLWPDRHDEPFAPPPPPPVQGRPEEEWRRVKAEQPKAAPPSGWHGGAWLDEVIAQARAVDSQEALGALMRRLADGPREGQPAHTETMTDTTPLSVGHAPEVAPQQGAAPACR